MHEQWLIKFDTLNTYIFQTVSSIFGGVFVFSWLGWLAIGDGDLWLSEGVGRPSGDDAGLRANFSQANSVIVHSHT